MRCNNPFSRRSHIITQDMHYNTQNTQLSNFHCPQFVILKSKEFASDSLPARWVSGSSPRNPPQKIHSESIIIITISHVKLPHIISHLPCSRDSPPARRQASVLVGCRAWAPRWAPPLGDAEEWPLKWAWWAPPTAPPWWAWRRASRKAWSSRTCRRPTDSTVAFSKAWATLGGGDTGVSWRLESERTANGLPETDYLVSNRCRCRAAGCPSPR